MPAVNRTVTILPASATETGGNSNHWDTTTSPEGTRQAGDTSLIIKALNAPIDGGGVPWTFNGPSPNINFGMVRTNSIAAGGAADLIVTLDQLRADPNEYISKVSLRWRGANVQSGTSAADLTHTLRLRASDAGGTLIQVLPIAAADMTAIQAAATAANWWENVIPLTPATLATLRSKRLAVEFQQANITGTNKSGWRIDRMHVIVELSLKSPVRSVG